MHRSPAVGTLDICDIATVVSGQRHSFWQLDLKMLKFITDNTPITNKPISVLDLVVNMVPNRFVEFVIEYRVC